MFNKSLYKCLIVFPLFFLVACTKISIDDVNTLNAAAESEEFQLVHIDPYSWVREQISEVKSVENTDLNWLVNERNKSYDYFSNKQAQISTINSEIDSRKIPSKVTNTYFYRGHHYLETLLPGAEYKQYYATDSEKTKKTLIFDAQYASEGKKNYKLKNVELSPDGKHAAIVEELIDNQSYALHIIHVESQEYLPISGLVFSGDFSWHPDSNQIYYVANDETEFTRPANLVLASIKGGKSKLIFEEARNDRFTFVERATWSDHLLIRVASYTTVSVHVLDMNEPDSPPVLYLPEIEVIGWPDLSYQDSDLLVVNNSQQGNYTVQAYYYENGSLTESTVFRGDQGVTNEYAAFFDNHIVVIEAHTMTDKLMIFDKETGKKSYPTLPEESQGIRFVNPINSNSDVVSVFYKSYKNPTRTINVDLSSGEWSEDSPISLDNYNPLNYVVQRLDVESRDGKMIPVTMMYHKDTPRSPETALVLHVYGSLGYGKKPDFPRDEISLIDRGFIYAFAHVRGGNELGQDWYEQGKGSKRHNSINDYLDVANRLISLGYTSKGNIAAYGRSAAGQIIGVAVNQQPDLFRTVALQVPFVDVINTLLDKERISYEGDMKENGDPRESQEIYNYISTLSPVDTVKKQIYPSIYATAALSDSAVGPWEPIKWVFRIRDNQKNSSNTILDIRDGNHFHATESAKIHQKAKQFSFILSEFGISQ